MAILKERGLFWWNDQTVPNGRFAPKARVSGQLTIENDGGIALEIDGMMSFPGEAISGMMQEEARIQDNRIQGILNATDRHVLLIDISNGGARTSTHGFSTEGYRARDCLVRQQLFPATSAPPTSSRLEIGLDGLEAWLQLGSITSSRSPERVAVEYVRPVPAVYQTEDGLLELNFHLTGANLAGGRSDEVSMKEKVGLVLSLKEPVALDGLREHFRVVEDLLVLLIGSHYRLDWPFLSLDDDQRVRWYFRRFSGDDVPSAPKWHECWTNFIELRDAFGAIWSNWKAKREIFGPGVYMYLSILRGVSLYTEHRFVNLVWGIEALHRAKHPTAGSAKVLERIENVLSEISKPKDKKWLQQKLKHAHEPALEQRIYEVLKSIPIDIEQKRLRAFATSCATARNDLSHFGGHRQGAQNAFSKKLHNLSEALSILYRCVLLAEIGVDSTIVKRQLHGIGGLESARLQWCMADVGLIDKASLRRGK